MNDISGKKFNALTALYVVSRTSGEVIWHCKCDCGNELDLTYKELVYSNRKSCGCRKTEHNKRLNQTLTHFSGTSLDMIKSKTVPSDSTTGIRGVYYIKGKYHAKIVFRKKAYYLGVYDNLEDASKARTEAEADLFDRVVEHYEKWNALAKADPEWAKSNPIEISVEKSEANRLLVRCFPQIDP